MKSLSSILENKKYKALIKQHIFEHGINIIDSPLRIDSESFSELVNTARELFENGLYQPSTENEMFILEKLDTGKEGIYIDDGKRKQVKLDLPQENPNRTKDKKRFVVYRAGEKTDDESGLPIARKILFSSWDKGLDINNDDEGSVNSFWARQQCDKKKDPNAAGWWACYAPEMFGDKLKLRGGKSRW